MHIQALGFRRLLIELSRSDMASYGVEFRSMTLSDSQTRLLLNDMLAVIGKMGFWEQGDRVTVECAQSSHGGCTFVIEIRGRERYCFECCDDVISAAAAGALPDEYDIERENERWIILPHGYLDESKAAFLNEFTCPLQER